MERTNTPFSALKFFEIFLYVGKIDISKYSPLAYISSDYAYVTLGKKVGTAFCDGLKLK